jgi:deoxyribose-phosphate aldolase
MRPDLERRFLKVAHNLDRLEQLRNLVEDVEQTSPRSLIASAAVAGAEFIAAATGYSDDAATIHRA